MTIREMMLADYEAMYDLWLACEGVSLGDSDSREQIGLFLAWNVGKSFVAEVNGRLVGTILGGHGGGEDMCIIRPFIPISGLRALGKRWWHDAWRRCRHKAF